MELLGIKECLDHPVSEGQLKFILQKLPFAKFHTNMKIREILDILKPLEEKDKTLEKQDSITPPSVASLTVIHPENPEEGEITTETFDPAQLFLYAGFEEKPFI
jgi:hypothetical protein